MSEKTDKILYKKRGDKSMEGRRFAVLAPQSVITLAETCGISELNEELAGKIGEDATYRLREIIQGCSVHMRNTHERVLRSTDVARVLPNCSEMQIHGYLSGGSSDFVHVPDADVFVSEYNEVLVNLPRIALEDLTYVQEKEEFVTGTLFQDFVEPASEVEVEVLASTSNSSSPVNVPVLPSHLVSYYSTMSKVVLCMHGELLETVLQDLQKNSNITLLVPYFLNFLIEGLQELPRGSDACEHLLLMLHSLSMNPYIYRDAAVVVSGLLTCLLVYAVDPLPSEIVSVSKDFEHRELAAEAVVKVMVHWYGCDNSMLNNILQKMEVILFDTCSSVRSHLGALSVLCFFGEAALNRCFWPSVGKYLDFLSQLPSDFEALEMEGCVLKAAGLLYRQDFQSADITNEERNILMCRMAVCDRVLYSYFGDSVCAQWRCSLRGTLSMYSWAGCNLDATSKLSSKEIKIDGEEHTMREKAGRCEAARSSWSWKFPRRDPQYPSSSGWHSKRSSQVSCLNNDEMSILVDDSSTSSGIIDGHSLKKDRFLSTTKPVQKSARWKPGEMKNSGGSLSDMFDRFSVKKPIVRISSIRGLPVWDTLQQRELDPFHQLFCGYSFYHEKCLQLNHVGKFTNISMPTWNINFNGVLSTCL